MAKSLGVTSSCGVLLSYSSAGDAKVKSTIDNFVAFLRSLDKRSIAEFENEFHMRLSDIQRLVLSSNDASRLRAYCLAATEAEFRLSRIISHGRRKPFGYSGDFQIIDWTYEKAVISDCDRGRLWDEFYHRQIAPLAVCDRKQQFAESLANLSILIRERPLRILNVGSGPGREILDGAYYAGLTPDEIKVICVDADRQALEYSRRLLGDAWDASVIYENRNALRYHPKETFHLVWSSGLFDYLDQRLATHLLKLMWSVVAVGGRLAIGNFADTHPTRPWIELCGDWLLVHRSERDMRELAKLAGIEPAAARVDHVLDAHKAIRFLIVDRLA